MHVEMKNYLKKKEVERKNSLRCTVVVDDQRTSFLRYYFFRTKISVISIA